MRRLVFEKYFLNILYIDIYGILYIYVSMGEYQDICVLK